MDILEPVSVPSVRVSFALCALAQGSPPGLSSLSETKKMAYQLIFTTTTSLQQYTIANGQKKSEEDGIRTHSLQ